MVAWQVFLVLYAMLVGARALYLMGVKVADGLDTTKTGSVVAGMVVFTLLNFLYTGLCTYIIITVFGG